MPLYRNTPALSSLELKVRVREEYERVTLSQTEDAMEANDLITLGPRVVTYPDSRSLLAQMSGVQTRAARLQMAYTMLAVGSVMLSLQTEVEAS
jgi:hypothetical protein